MNKTNLFVGQGGVNTLPSKNKFEEGDNNNEK
jgi:hypothetical protein